MRERTDFLKGESVAINVRTNDDRARELSIDGGDYLHIKKVDVFIGPDNREETDIWTLQLQEYSPSLPHSSKTILSAVNTRPITYKHAKGRLRGEPGVRLYLQTEDLHPTNYVLHIYHHKGKVCFVCEVEK